MFCSEFRDRLCAQSNNSNVARISTKSKMGFLAIDSQLSDIFQSSDKIAGEDDAHLVFHFRFRQLGWHQWIREHRHKFVSLFV